MYFDELGMDDYGEGLESDWREVRRVAAAFADAATVGEPWIRKHLLSIASIARLVGLQLELKPQQLETLVVGALLHDIGKLGVPYRVLMKRGPLTEDEWQMVRKHPVTGCKIIEPVGFLDKAKDIVLHHHERYDGKGYPDGLVGDQIPLLTRIVTIADSVSAMITDRPYRLRLSKERVFSELEKHAGVQFDPRLVQVMMIVLDDIYPD